jgi:hypothetical protein
MKVLDTSKDAKEATWHTKIDPWSNGYKCMGQVGCCYNIDVVTNRLKDRLYRVTEPEMRKGLGGGASVYIELSSVVWHGTCGSTVNNNST